MLRKILVLLPLLAVAACAAESENPEGSSADELRTRGGGGGSDGTPTPRQCTSTFGSQLTGGSHGRLDGYLVAMVPAGTHSCHGDANHLHLQILMNNAVYDVAVNVDQVDFAEVNAPLVDGAWSEGWHANGPLDYVNDLSLHSSSFASTNKSALAQQLTNELSSANHVSIFATKYSDSGIHLVHRTRTTGSGQDGAIVINPLSPNAHYFAFHFSDQSF
jgi:hypothetical protein